MFWSLNLIKCYLTVWTCCRLDQPVGLLWVRLEQIRENSRLWLFPLSMQWSLDSSFPRRSRVSFCAAGTMQLRKLVERSQTAGLALVSASQRSQSIGSGSVEGITAPGSSDPTRRCPSGWWVCQTRQHSVRTDALDCFETAFSNEHKRFLESFFFTFNQEPPRKQEKVRN